MLTDIATVFEKLEKMEDQRIWPNGTRYLWTDAFGLVLLVSLYNEFEDNRFLEKAERLVADVDRVLGRSKGYRIGEEPDRDGQYYHYLAMWIYALHRFGAIEPAYWRKAVDLVHDIHPHFVIPNVGVIWKMDEGLDGPYPGYGLGALDAFHGYVVYSLLAPDELSTEIAEMKTLIEKNYRTLNLDQDLGLGMMLWMTQFFPHDTWAVFQLHMCLDTLNDLWIDPPGFYCRHPGLRDMKFAFTNYGVSLGLQAVGELPQNVERLNEFFRTYRSGDEYDMNAITHVMACTSHYPGEFIMATKD